MTSISLVVSSYNQLDYLKVALASVEGQTKPYDEVIVIDDASSDGSPSFLRKWASEGENRKAICFEQNQGLSAARNAGFQHVTSEYGAVLDGDDWLVPEAVENIQQVLALHQPDLVVFQANYYLEAEDRYLDRPLGSKLYRDDAYSMGILRNAKEKEALFRMYPPQWLKIHRMDFVNKHQIANRFKIYEDILWHHQVAVLAEEIHCIRKPLINYRVHAKSVLRSVSPDHLTLIDVMDACEAFMKSTPCSPGLRKASHRYQFDIGANMVLHAGRLPEELRPGFARQILDRDYLFDFDMEDFELEFLDQLRSLAPAKMLQ